MSSDRSQKIRSQPCAPFEDLAEALVVGDPVFLA